MSRAEPWKTIEEVAKPKGDTWRNIDVIIYNLLTLRAQYELYGNDEDYWWWFDEDGCSLLWQIDCHPVFRDGRPCLNDVRGVEYGGDGWEDNCAECKARYMMEVYE